MICPYPFIFSGRVDGAGITVLFGVSVCAAVVCCLEVMGRDFSRWTGHPVVMTSNLIIMVFPSGELRSITELFAPGATRYDTQHKFIICPERVFQISLIYSSF